MTYGYVNYGERERQLQLTPMAEEKQTMGGRILRQLEVKNLSQADLARTMDTTRSTVNQWCRDISLPTPDNLVTIAHILFDDDVQYLVHGVDRQPPGGFPTVPRGDSSGSYLSPFSRRRKT